MSVSRFEANEKSLGNLLRDEYRYTVPIHQRDYSWTQDQLEQFFSDIEFARRMGESEYFIGLMVFISENGPDIDILDGQQRLATTVILLSSIRRWFASNNLGRDATKLETEYISNRRFGEDEERARLILNIYNRTSFERYVIRDIPTSEITAELSRLNSNDHNRRLFEAIIYCRSKIDEYLSDCPDIPSKSKKLYDYLNYLLEGVKLVQFTVSSDSNAYTIFETLNDRGLDLTILDLVKNYLFGKAGTQERVEEIQRYWTQITSTLTNVPADNFLKTYWTSRFGRIQKAQLYKYFKENVRTWDDVISRCEDMQNSAEIYSALDNPNDSVWASLSETSRHKLKALDIMDAKQVHPIILSGFSKFEPTEFERLLKMLEVLIARYQLFGERRTGRLELSCSELSHQIYEGKVTSATSAFNLIKDLYISDEEFKIDFISNREKNSKKIRYVLAVLEAEKRRREGKELKIEYDAIDSLTLEHILPKRPSADWSKLLATDPSIIDLIYSYGNMCLLTSGNRALGNRTFDVKKDAYDRCDWLLTKTVTDYKDWNKASIENRLTHLSNLAISAWRFP